MRLAFAVVLGFVALANASPSGLRGMKAPSRCAVRPELVAAHPDLKSGYEILCGEPNCAEALANYCIPVGTTTDQVRPPRSLREDATFAGGPPCTVRPELIAGRPDLKDEYEALCAEPNCAVALANYCVPVGASFEDMVPPHKAVEASGSRCVVRPELAAAHPDLKEDYEVVCRQPNCATSLANYCIPVGANTSEMAPPRKMRDAAKDVPKCVVRPELLAAFPDLKEGYEALCGERDCAVAFANYCIPTGATASQAGPPHKMN